MSFFLGAATGVGNELQAGQERTRKRVERQLEEARSYVEVARKRQTAADEVRTQITNASRSYGVRPEVFHNAYKDGKMDDLIKLYDTAARTGQRVDPSILESWYTVPTSVEMDEETRNREIDNIFGVIRQGIQDRGTIDDASAAELLFAALTGGGEAEVQRRLRGQTVGGYDVEELLAMPGVSPAQGVGGSINPEAYKWLDDNKLRESDRQTPDVLPSNDERQWGKALATPFAADLFGRFGGRFASEAHKAFLEAAVERDAVLYVQSINQQGGPVPSQLPPSFIRNYVREVGGETYILSDKTDEDGNKLWHKVDDNGTVVSTAVKLEDEEPDGTAPRPSEVETLPLGPLVEPQTSSPRENAETRRFPQEVDGARLVGIDPESGYPVYELPSRDGGTPRRKLVDPKLLDGFFEETEIGPVERDMRINRFPAQFEGGVYTHERTLDGDPVYRFPEGRRVIPASTFEDKNLETNDGIVVAP